MKETYSQSGEILRLIKDGKAFMINIHQIPDMDSVASALALCKVLKGMGKKVVIYSPDRISPQYQFLEGGNEIIEKKFIDINFSDFDIFCMVDSESWDRVGMEEYKGGARVVNIDHHPRNTVAGEVNLIDPTASATCEILYLLLKDANIEIDPKLATILLAGILSDTNFFQNSAKSRILSIASTLVEKGADINFVSENLLRRNSFDSLKLWGVILANMKVDWENKFVWSALSFDEFKIFDVSVSPTGQACDMFARTVEGTNFGIVIVEKTPNTLYVSIRSRESWFDVSIIAREFGGGGHMLASGGGIKNVPFEEAVKMVLSAAKKHAHQTK